MLWSLRRHLFILVFPGSSLKKCDPGQPCVSSAPTNSKFGCGYFEPYGKNDVGICRNGCYCKKVKPGILIGICEIEPLLAIHTGALIYRIIFGLN